MDVNNVLIGISASDVIAQGNFFRLTFGRTRRLGLPVELFSFQHDSQALFDKLDAADGLAQPVSDLAVAPGQEAAVFDVLVRPFAVGFTAADLANYFDGLRFGVSLTSMTLIDSGAVINGKAERDALQLQLSDGEKAKDPLAVLGTAEKYLQWILILAIAAAVIYLGTRAVSVVKGAKAIL